MKISVFEYDDYKSFLRASIASADKGWGSITRLSEAAGCQRSYLSRVLSGDLHLTPDHLYGIAVSVSLSEDETEYLLTLLQIERAASLAFKKRLLTKARAMKAQFNDLQKRVNRPPASVEEKDLVYYSSWLYSALHIIASIGGLQTTKAIAEHLQISPALTESTLKQLLAWGLVGYRRGKWEFANSERHVPRNSPLVSLHHQNWRQRAVLDAQSLRGEGLHFTVVQSVSRAALERVKSKLLAFIQEASDIAGPSEPEKLVCLTADFFEV